MYFHVETKIKAYEIWRGYRLSELPHIHSHIEIVYMKSGSSECHADSRVVTAESGDLFISFPNQIHYYVDSNSGVSPILCIVSPDICPEFGKIFSTLVPDCPVYRNAANNPRVVMALESLLSLVNSSDEYSEAEMRGHMLILLSEIFKNMTLVENDNCDNNLVKEVMNYCYDNYAGDISLKSISEALHISRFYVSRVFSKRLRVSLSDYINSVRVQNACDMLKRTGGTVTEIADAVGYNSARNFDRCFLKIKGVTPREYRASVFSVPPDKG